MSHSWARVSTICNKTGWVCVYITDSIAIQCTNRFTCIPTCIPQTLHLDYPQLCKKKERKKMHTMRNSLKRNKDLLVLFNYGVIK